MSIFVVWSAGVKEDSEKFSEKKEFLPVDRDWRGCFGNSAVAEGEAA